MFIFRVVPCQFGGYYRLIPPDPNHRNTDHPIGFTLTRCPRDAPQKQGWSLVRNVRQNIGRCLSKDSEGFTNFYPSRFTLMGSQWTFIDLLWNQLKYANVGVHSYQYSRQAWNILDSRLSCMGPSIYNAIDCQWLATTTKKTMRRRMNEKKKKKSKKTKKEKEEDTTEHVHHRWTNPPSRLWPVDPACKTRSFTSYNFHKIRWSNWIKLVSDQKTSWNIFKRFNGITTTLRDSLVPPAIKKIYHPQIPNCIRSYHC